jgi:hypothetical protein
VTREAVYDSAGFTSDNYRIATVIAYRDSAVVARAHLEARQAAEQRTHWGGPLHDDNGPELRSGYGGSVWRVNVARDASGAHTLNGLFTEPTKRANESRAAGSDGARFYAAH